MISVCLSSPWAVVYEGETEVARLRLPDNNKPTWACILMGNVKQITIRQPIVHDSD